ncbi:MAG: carbohydrate-binding domain-containing protein [Clostridiales bacterium]|nr:carbohydrate-binding domain-containing protein [Clostridiales bacterium]
MSRSEKSWKAGQMALLLLAVLTLMWAGTMRASAASTVATIGSTKYTSLQKAFDAVKDGQTIVLQKDVSSSSTITVSRSGKSFTLNLNKHTLTFKKAAYLYVKKGTLTIRNGKIVQAGPACGSNYTVTSTVVKIASNAKVTILSGTYRGEIINKGTMTISGGTFTNAGTTTSEGYTLYGDILNNSGTMTIKGGTVKQSSDCATYGINVTNLAVNTGTMKISGGTFSAIGTGGSVLNKGTLTITGGDFSKTGEVSSYAYGALDNEGTLTIKKGTFTADTELSHALYSSGGKVVISGGTFTGNSAYGVVYFADTTATIKEGTIKGNYEFARHLFIAYNSTIKITGGTFKVTGTPTRSTPTAILAAWEGAKITVTDGTFSGKSVVMLYAEGTGKITVSGGTFTGSKAYKYRKLDGGKVTIKGGTFNVKYTAYTS